MKYIMTTPYTPSRMSSIARIMHRGKSNNAYEGNERQNIVGVDILPSDINCRQYSKTVPL